MEFEVRDRSINQGRRRLTREREVYLALVRQGASSREACKIVGINRKTGQRWRNERNPTGREVGANPITASAPDCSSRFLREDERLHIADRLREKATVRAIAAELGRAPSTISRESAATGIPSTVSTGRTPPTPAR